MLNVNWTFFARGYGWGATSEYRFKIGDLAPTGPVYPKFHVKENAPTNHSSSQKTSLNDLSSGIKIWTDLSSVLSQSTRLSDRQRDGRKEFSSLDRVCIPCSAVKMRVILRRLITNLKIAMCQFVPNFISYISASIIWFGLQWGKLSQK